MGFAKVEPGLSWSPSKKKNVDGRTIGTARIEVIRPGTQGRVRKRLTLERVTYEDAASRLDAERSRISGDGLPPPETFGGFLDRYADECLDRVRPRTRKTYESAIRNHLRPFFGSAKLAAFEKTGAYQIGRFTQAMKKKRKLKYLRGKGLVEGATALTPQTINGTLRILRLLLNYARQAGVLRAVGKEMFKSLDEPTRDHTPRLPELAAFFRTFDDEVAFRTAYQKKLGHAWDSPLYGLYFARHRWLRPFFIVAAETGFRLGDLLGLQQADVNMDAGLITITMQKTGKTATSGITPVLAEALKELQARTVVSTTHIFLAWNGKPLSVTSVRRSFELGKELAGISRRLKFHGLRHGVGYRLAAAGVPLYLIQRQLGHASAETTALYLEAAGDHIGIATDALTRTGWAGK